MTNQDLLNAIGGADGDWVRDAHTSRRRWLAAALIAAVLCLLTATVCTATLWGWLEPVVRGDGNEDLIEAYTVPVRETVPGVHCDVTLERAVTDGNAVYALFTAACDDEFIDPDDAITWCSFHYGTGWTIQSGWRTDDGTEPGIFHFIAVTAGNYDDGQPMESILGKTVELELCFLDDSRTGVMEAIETYVFSFSCNETISSVNAEWADGTALHVTPLMLELDYGEKMPEPFPGPDTEPDAIQLEFTDGRRLSLADALPQQHQGTTGLRCVKSWDRATLDGEQDASFCHLSALLPELTVPQTVAAILIHGQRYTLSDAVHLTATTAPASER